MPLIHMVVPVLSENQSPMNPFPVRAHQHLLIKRGFNEITLLLSRPARPHIRCPSLFTLVQMKKDIKDNKNIDFFFFFYYFQVQFEDF